MSQTESKTFPVYFLCILILSSISIPLLLILTSSLNEDNSFSFWGSSPALIISLGLLFMSFSTYNHRVNMYADQREIEVNDRNSSRQIIYLNGQITGLLNERNFLRDKLKKQTQSRNFQQKPNELPPSKDLYFHSNPDPQDKKVREGFIQSQQNRSNYVD